MKTLKCIALVLLTNFFVAWAQAPVITQSGGWLESAYVEWSPQSGVTNYQVFFSGGGLSNQRLDNHLIRNYGTHWRADALGLRPGTYTMRIVPLLGNSEGSAATTGNLQVIAHLRSGFAFAQGRKPGAYNLDGTPMNGAVIVYVTENNKNTLSMNITGANSNPCVGLQAILDGIKRGRDLRPFIFRIVGQITNPAVLYNGDLVIENNNIAQSFLTLEGVGKDATIDGWGIRLKNAINVEIRNLGIMNVRSSEGDNLSLQQDNQNIWIHNNDFFYGDAGSDADQAKGDGALDCKRSTFVTFSFNHFWDTGKANLLGLSENTTTGLFITYHHNWYNHSDSRHPRVRFYSAHVYNNYYDGISKYGIGATMGASVFAEANYFRNARYPMLISMQGSDVWNPTTQANDYNNMPTFSSEDGGIIKAFNNYMEGQHRFVAHGATGFANSTVDFDAFIATSRNQQVPASVVSAYGANRYNNFDTDASIMYSYTPDSPQEAVLRVTTYAGRVQGGDFRWTFNNAVDDASSEVNTGLKAALVAYRTRLVSILAEGSGTPPISSSAAISSSAVSSSSGNISSSAPSSSSQALSSSGTTGSIGSTTVHNFTLSGISSAFFNIVGNLSTTKGTVIYGGLTLTQCLKLETETSIAFNLAAPAQLTLVFNPDFQGRVMINGTQRTVQNGVLTISLAAGSHLIGKGDTSNLYYMALQILDAPVSLLANPKIGKPTMRFDFQRNRVIIRTVDGQGVERERELDGQVR